MRCRCAEMTKLRKNINILIETKSKSSSFYSSINSSEAEQEYLKTDSWSAAQSTMLKSDIERKLPNMADKIEEAHSELINEIDSAIKEMEEVYGKLEEEDNEYHAE